MVNFLNSNKSELPSKGPWTKEEDDLFLQGLEKYRNLRGDYRIPKNPFQGIGISYVTIKTLAPGLRRTPKQMRERYLNFLSPRVVKSVLPEHGDLIMKLHKEHGNSWVKISEVVHREVFKGEMYYSEQLIKNWCNNKLRKEKLERRGELLKNITWSPEEISYIQDVFKDISN